MVILNNHLVGPMLLILGEKLTNYDMVILNNHLVGPLLLILGGKLT